jgi:hypothetical protein
MNPKIKRVGAQYLKVANDNFQVALFAGALLLFAISNDFDYVPVMPVSEVLMLILIIGSGPALLIRAWHGQSHLEHSASRRGVAALALIGLSYGWARHQPDLLVASAALTLQLAGMWFYARRARRGGEKLR